MRVRRRQEKPVRIHTLPAGPIETNAYLLTDADRGEALLVDAPHGVLADIEPILRETGTKLVALLVTHGHWDHTGDIARIQRTGVPVYAHEADRVMIETPQSMARYMIPGLELEPAKIDHTIVQGQHLVLLGRDVEIRHVPGHCPGNVLFYFAAPGAAVAHGAGVAFVGDALFSGSIGRTDLPGGSFEQLAASIRGQIYTLPDATVVYPGHGPSTTVAVEKRDNPFVPA
jgi:glyoxylase-like metal-dependent hydrolase (beta-lactamase superfamily II)